jgi:hypothetical protein
VSWCGGARSIPCHQCVRASCRPWSSGPGYRHRFGQRVGSARLHFPSGGRRLASQRVVQSVSAPVEAWELTDLDPIESRRIVTRRVTPRARRPGGLGARPTWKDWRPQGVSPVADGGSRQARSSRKGGLPVAFQGAIARRRSSPSRSLVLASLRALHLVRFHVGDKGRI